MLQQNNYRVRPNMQTNRQSDGTRINEEIRISPIRLVKTNGESVVIETTQALQLAKEEGLDLVEVSPKAKPPVCRIMDYGKCREIAHTDYGRRLMDQAKIDLANYGDLDMDSRMEGNTMLSIYSPKRGSTSPKEKKEPKPVTEPMAAGEAST